MKNTSKNNYFFLLVSCLLAALFVAAPAYAQADKTAEIDKIFSWTKTNEPGCAVAVSQNGKLVASRAYGSADLERNAPLSTNSIFDIGSVRKQFIAAAILLLVEDGRLSLSDDIRKHFPVNARLRAQDHNRPSAHPYRRHSRLDCALSAGGRKCRAIALDPASARTKFRAGRGMVLLEQRLHPAG